MSDTLFILAVLFLTFVAPVWIIAHYVTRGRLRRERAAGQDKTLAELMETAQRMERRIEALERILDAEAPQWRDQL